MIDDSICVMPPKDDDIDICMYVQQTKNGILLQLQFSQNMLTKHIHLWSNVIETTVYVMVFQGTWLF